MSVYTLKGFVAISGLINNNPGVNSKIGEPSLWSLTYTKERGSYESEDTPGYKLVSLSSMDSDVGKVSVNKEIADHALAVSAWAYDYLLGMTQPINKIAFINALKVEFFGDVEDVASGDFIAEGAARMPEWVSWKNITNEDANIKVWYADDSFKAQFDEFEIVVIPPLPNLDDFFSSPTTVQNKLAARTPKIVTNAIQEAKGGNPETYIRTETFEYISPVDTAFKLQTNWSFLIYGQQGDNLDDIKNKIIEYILENSTHTVEEWIEVFPDIFKKTEFYLLPRWDIMAIEDLTTQPGIYSPIIALKETNTFARQKLSHIPTAVIDNTLSAFTHPYKSVAIACVSGPDNRENATDIREVFPDYINVGTLSQDFNRMSEASRNWSNLMERMLIQAESATEFSALPQDMRRVKRNNITYIGAVLNNIQFIMAPRSLYGV
jgi:hypothetical protein